MNTNGAATRYPNVMSTMEIVHRFTVDIVTIRIRTSNTIYGRYRNAQREYRAYHCRDLEFHRHSRLKRPLSTRERIDCKRFDLRVNTFRSLLTRLSIESQPNIIDQSVIVTQTRKKPPTKKVEGFTLSNDQTSLFVYCRFLR